MSTASVPRSTRVTGTERATAPNCRAESTAATPSTSATATMVTSRIVFLFGIRFSVLLLLIRLRGVFQRHFLARLQARADENIALPAPQDLHGPLLEVASVQNIGTGASILVEDRIHRHKNSIRNFLHGNTSARAHARTNSRIALRNCHLNIEILGEGPGGVIHLGQRTDLGDGPLELSPGHGVNPDDRVLADVQAAAIAFFHPRPGANGAQIGKFGDERARPCAIAFLKIRRRTAAEE